MNLREQLAKELGISKQSVVEQALRVLAKQFNIKEPEVSEQDEHTSKMDVQGMPN